MIRFSNKIKYGLQFLLFIELDNEEYTDIQRAAISCNIPHKFLESIAVNLKKGGIVGVKRGAGGGYRLTRSPQDISLTEIVCAIEKLDSKARPYPANMELTREVVENLLGVVMEQFWLSLERITLHDLHLKYSEKTEKIMYYI